MNGFSLQFDIVSYTARTAVLQSDDDLLNFARGELELDGLLKPPKAKKIPMMAARRLGTGTRLAVDVALELIEKYEDIDACVFSSRHGELGRNDNILNALAKGEETSPTDFTMSVHNSAVANTVITAKKQIPTSSVAAGADSFISGLMEAYLMLESGLNKVLVVDFEGHIQSAYKDLVPSTTKDIPYAVAVVIAKGNKIALSAIVDKDSLGYRAFHEANVKAEDAKAKLLDKTYFPSGIVSLDLVSKLALGHKAIEVKGERNIFNFKILS